MDTRNDTRIIEAVPNFSEGRRPEVIEAILTAIQTPGVLLLNHSSDSDHNRTVVTVAGPPGAILDGLFAAIQVAAERIDLHTQRGAHPRLGATDVVPLIPIHDCTLAECAEWAIQLGRRIGADLQLPVYLYEAAATRPDRINLADVRRGEFEGLLQEITRPERRPDFGPTRVGPAGAVILGARRFLIAWNFFLQSDDLAIARAISRAIRASSDGFPGVKAIGLLVDGRAQVSVNLVDHTQTGLYELTTRVTALARQHGTALERTELIGLLPMDALLQAAADALHLPGLSPEQVFEWALTAARQTRG